MKTLDTRDLYTRKCELESLRDAVTEARAELKESEAALAKYSPKGKMPSSIAKLTAELGRTPEEGLATYNASLLTPLEEAVETAQSNLESAESDFGTDEENELTELESLESDISDFMHGETMIPESDFEEYARELAEDMGTMEGSEWPCTCIDWKQAAEELAMDYTSVTYQGTDYLVRA